VHTGSRIAREGPLSEAEIRRHVRPVDGRQIAAATAGKGGDQTDTVRDNVAPRKLSPCQDELV